MWSCGKDGSSRVKDGGGCRRAVGGSREVTIWGWVNAVLTHIGKVNAVLTHTRRGGGWRRGWRACPSGLLVDPPLALWVDV